MQVRRPTKTKDVNTRRRDEAGNVPSKAQKSSFGTKNCSLRLVIAHGFERGKLAVAGPKLSRAVEVTEVVNSPSLITDMNSTIEIWHHGDILCAPSASRGSVQCPLDITTPETLDFFLIGFDEERIDALPLRSVALPELGRGMLEGRGTARGLLVLGGGRLTTQLCVRRVQSETRHRGWMKGEGGEEGEGNLSLEIPRTAVAVVQSGSIASSPSPSHCISFFRSNTMYSLSRTRIGRRSSPSTLVLGWMRACMYIPNRHQRAPLPFHVSPAYLSRKRMLLYATAARGEQAHVHEK